MKLTTSAQMRELDRIAIEERKIPSIDLMERAAEGVAAAAMDLLPENPSRCRIAALCGAGNNGGDGIAAARLLFFKGVQVRCFLVGTYERLTPDSLEMTRRLSDCGVELEPFAPENEEQLGYIRRCDAVVDAVFGVGLSREVAAGSVFAAAFDAMNASRAKVVSADIASGVEADTGRILGRAVRADRTVTFTFPKIGQAVGDGAVYSGDVTVWNIGIPADLTKSLVSPVQTVEPDFVRWALPPRKIDGHKGTFGKLLIVGGAVGYTGAPYLTASAAVRTGCGLVSLGVPEAIWPMEAAKWASAMPFPLPEKGGMLSAKALRQILEKLSGCDVLAWGPGLGRSEGTARLVWELLKTEKPVVLDADGINALSGHIDVLDARRGRITVLTPHDVEFGRIGGDLGLCRGPRLRAGAERPPDRYRRAGGQRPGEYHRRQRPFQGGQRRCPHRCHCIPAGSGSRGGPGGCRRRVAPRPVRRPGGAGTDGLRRHAGGCGPGTARSHPGNSGITEGKQGAHGKLRTNDSPVPAAVRLRGTGERNAGYPGCLPDHVRL